MANATLPTRVNPWTPSNDFTRSIVRQTGIPLFEALSAGGGRPRGGRPFGGRGIRGRPGAAAGGTFSVLLTAPVKAPKPTIFQGSRDSGRNR
jgi:hypothetical protein